MRNNNSFLLQLILFCSCILSFCSCCVGPCIVADPYVVSESRQKENFYYVPSSVNAPLLDKKNDLSFSMQRSASPLHSGVEIQTAFLPGKHVGIIGGYSGGGNKKDNTLTYHKLELGAGYILPAGNRWHFEIYGGYGSSKIDNKHYTGASIIKSQYFFLQPAMAVSNEKQTVQFGFVSKLLSNHFNVTLDGFDKDREPYNASQVALLKEKANHIFWEPGIVFRFGWKNFLFHTGYSVSEDLTTTILHRPKGDFSMGMYLKFNTGKIK